MRKVEGGTPNVIMRHPCKHVTETHSSFMLVTIEEIYSY